MATQPTFPMISATEEVNCGIGSDCEITLICNNKRFIVLLSRETIEKLHKVGVVWGDAKADNILIDKNDDAWEIDFGGGGLDRTLGPPRISGQCQGRSTRSQEYLSFSRGLKAKRLLVAPN